MLFKDIKQGSLIFVLDKQSLTVKSGKAISVGFPRLDMNPTTGKTDMLIDITVETDGKATAYAIPENLSTSYAGNIVISTTQKGLADEVKLMINSADQYFAAEAYHRQIKEKCPALLAELDPAIKNKQETDKRFGELEQSISKLTAVVQNLITKINPE